MWHSTSLLVHFVALGLLSGAAVGGAVVDVMFWRRLRRAPAEAAALTPFMVALSTVAPLGAGLLLLSGVSLLASVHFVLWGMLWLNVKLVLFVLLVLNGALLAGPTSRRIHALMPAWIGAPGKRGEVGAELERLQRRTRFFHISENLGFVAILVMAVFKFV